MTQRDSGRLRFDTQRVGENSQVSRVASRQSAVVQVNTEESDWAKDNMALGEKKQTNKQILGTQRLWVIWNILKTTRNTTLAN